MTHAILITVLPSVALVAGQTESRKMAKRIDPSSKSFQKDLEALMLQIACLKQNELYEFECVKRCHIKHGIPSISKYVIRFQSRIPIARILSQNQSKFKKDFTLKYHEKELDDKPRFEGDGYHIPKIRDLALDQNIDLGVYIDQLLIGGMNPSAFTGIKAGDTIRSDNGGIKVHKHVEIFFDPTLTANHGKQDIKDPNTPGSTIDLQEEFGRCIPIPKFRILEPPSYVAWKDSTGYLHKRELKKSGNFCQHCWGPAHEPGFKCVYYNFCRACLAFNPREPKLKLEFGLNKHLCNYGITEMPDQRISAGPKKVIKEQVFNEDRKERMAQLERQAQVCCQCCKRSFGSKRRETQESLPDS